MLAELKKLTTARDLLYMLTWRDIQIRYKQSVMGFLWAILMPALIVGAGALIKIGMAKFNGTGVSANDVSSVMVRAVAWSFFVSTIRFGTNSLLSNSDLVTKIAFPKEVFPLAAVFSCFFDFIVAAAAAIAGMLLFGWRPTVEALWALPLITTLVMLAIGMTLVLSAANLFFRDVKYLVEVFLTYAIFFTPVLYEASFVGQWESVILLNPVAPLIEGLSDTLVKHQAPNFFWCSYSLSISALTLLISYWFFKQTEAKFAESI